MVFPGVKRLGEKLGLGRLDSVMMGVVGNCVVRLYDDVNMKVLHVTLPVADERDRAEIDAALVERKTKSVEWQGAAIRIVFPEYWKPYSMKTIEAILLRIVETAKAAHPDLSAACGTCGAVSGDADVYSFGAATLYLCGNCRAEIESKTAHERAEYESKPGNYVAGTLGAALFSLPGILLCAAFFVFFSRVAAVSALAFVFLATKGYAAFKGKPSKTGAVIVAAVGLFMTCFGTYLAYAAFVFTQAKTLELTLSVLSMREVRREAALNVILAVVVSIVYLGIQLVSMMKDWSPAVLKPGRKVPGR